MRVLLVDPPGKNKGFNTGLGYLAAVLNPDHEVRVLDLNNIEVGMCGDPNPDPPLSELEEIARRELREFQPDVFGISIKTFTADVSRYLFRWAGEERPGMARVAGGPHVILDGFRYVRDTKVEYGVQGEGEYVFPNLVKALATAGDVSKVTGLLRWEDGQLIQNPESDLIEELDTLPLPDYSQFTSVLSAGGRMRQYPILTSRGCPFKCSYCSMPTIMGRRWRFHSPERVVEELRFAKEKYGAESFTVVDDNLTLNLHRIDAISDQIIESGLVMPWNSMNGIRADRLTPESAQKMAHSGCYHVWIGIESADPHVFDTINKGEEFEDVKQGIRILKNAGIGVGGFFIVGLPNATREADLKSVDFVRELGIDAWWFQFVPYPYTPANDWVQTDATVTILRPAEGALQFGGGDIEPVFETSSYDKTERMRTYDDIHIKMGFYDRLFEPTRGQLANLWRVYKKVAPHGPVQLVDLGRFALTYNAKRTVRQLQRTFGVAARSVAEPFQPMKANQQS